MIGSRLRGSAGGGVEEQLFNRNGRLVTNSYAYANLEY